LLGESEASGFGSRAAVMSSLAIGADQDACAEICSEAAAPQFKRASRGELVIVVMRVDEKRFGHGEIEASLRAFAE
jgi:hypothetical protein